MPGLATHRSLQATTAGGARLSILLVALLTALLIPSALFAADPVQQMLDQGNAEQALDLLRRQIKGKPTPEQRMQRGTARLMLGDLKAGSADLEQSLKDDPSLRLGWINLGGLEIAEGNYRAAEKAFRKAYELAPELPESHLNLGASLILTGAPDDAKRYFNQYLKLEGGSGEAHYLVATNYAIGGLESEAVAALEKAVLEDERLRLRARRDDRFLNLNTLDYRVLLNTDSFRPPADHHRVEAAFRTRYSQQDGELLYAVLESLRKNEISYDPEVEAAAKWAIVWGDLRIKLRNQDNGTGVVSLSAAPDAMSRESFHRLSQQLFQSIHGILGP